VKRRTRSRSPSLSRTRSAARPGGDAFPCVGELAADWLWEQAFTGREWDPEIALYYYRARYYDSKLGRFLSEDPIGFRGGTNVYVYVVNNPARFTDPSGFEIYPPGGWSHPVQPSDPVTHAGTQGMAALIDGVIPFWDPLQDYYQDCEPCTMSKKIGEYEQDILLFIATTGTTEATTGAQVVIRSYPNAGGAGLSIRRYGKRLISFDWHRFDSAGRVVFRPHIDCPLLKLRHWPWPKP
jgi:RHS repeat-associated protein